MIKERGWNDGASCNDAEERGPRNNTDLCKANNPKHPEAQRLGS